MTDWHRPSTAAALSRYLAEASVYVLVTSVGADCYVCILSHGAIALRCALPVPSATNHPPTPFFSSPAPNYLQSNPQWPWPSLASLPLCLSCWHTYPPLSLQHLFLHKLKKIWNKYAAIPLNWKTFQQPTKIINTPCPLVIIPSMIIAFLLLDRVPAMTEAGNHFKAWWCKLEAASFCALTCV